MLLTTVAKAFFSKARLLPSTFGGRKLEWLPFRVASKYPQCIVWFCHKARVWQTDRRTDRITTPKIALAWLRCAVKTDHSNTRNKTSDKHRSILYRKHMILKRHTNRIINESSHYGHRSRQSCCMSFLFRTLCICFETTDFFGRSSITIQSVICIAIVQDR